MAEGFAHPEFLVETEWLAAHLGDPDLVILDSTTHLIPDPKITYTVKSGREDFETAHIPGAQFVDLQADLSDNTGRYGKLRFMLPGPRSLRPGSAASASATTAVVVYSTTAPQWAARVWWMLRNYGFDNAAVLNGGFQKWAREGRPVETGRASFAGSRTTFTVREDRKLMVGKEAVLGAIGDAATCTINALAPAQHAGCMGYVYGWSGASPKASTCRPPVCSMRIPAPFCRLPNCVQSSKRWVRSPSRRSSPTAAAASRRARMPSSSRCSATPTSGFTPPRGGIVQTTIACRWKTAELAASWKRRGRPAWPIARSFTRAPGQTRG